MIYFDNASTTSPSEDVLEEFIRANKEDYANANSIHALGMKNFANIDRIRKNILKTLGLNPLLYDVIFTSGATESNNLAIQGFASRNGKRFKHYLTSTVEHSSVAHVFKHLETLGYKVDYIKVNQDGVLDLDDLKAHLDGEPVFCSFMGVNNEVGTTNDLKKIREIIGPESIFHSDLVQTIGKEKVDLNSIDMFTFTGHKIYGLKGCGVLIKRKKIMINQLFYGGDQEDGLRPGTSDYPAICAFNLALTNVMKDFDVDYKNCLEIRKYLITELSKMDDIKIHDYSSCCPYILNISTLDKKASVVVEALSNKQIYVNSVSACYSKENADSFVILALGLPEEQAKNTIRLSFGKYNTLEEAKIFVKEFKEIIASIRGNND